MSSGIRFVISVVSLIAVFAALPARARLGDGSRSRSVAGEVSLEPCDRLFVVPVAIDGRTRTFLLDTGATTLVNSALFPPPAISIKPPGNSKRYVELTSVEGSKNVSGYFVTIKSLAFAGGELHDLNLTAIDLSKLRQNCGRVIEGMLGSDVLERLGIVIDMSARVARLRPRAEDLFPEVKRRFDEFAEFFNRADGTFLREHMDADIRWFAPNAEIRGRDALLEHFKKTYFEHHAQFTLLRMKPEDFHLAGDSYSLTYEFRIEVEDHTYQGRSMLFCHRKDGRWLIEAVNTSLLEIADD